MLHQYWNKSYVAFNIWIEYLLVMVNDDDDDDNDEEEEMRMMVMKAK